MEISRRKFVQLAGTGALAVSLGGLLSACSNTSRSGTSSNAAPGGASTSAPDQVIVSMTRESEPAAGFNPFYAWGCGEHVHEPLIQSTLITTDANLAFVNDLATAYSCSSDGLTWTFDIRDDAYFTDGEQLTAADVAFTLNGIKNFAGAQLDLSYLDEAVAVSSTRVEIRLNKPFNALLYTLAVVGIVPEHAYDAATYGANPIGSGRYLLEQWDQGQQAIFTANPAYYGPAPQIQRLVVVFMDEDASLAAAQSGEVDVAYTSATRAGQTPGGYSLFECATVDSRGISLPTVTPGSTTKENAGAEYPTGNAVTCHPEIRQAINYALDRQLAVDNVLAGYGSVAYSVCDSLPWASSDMRVGTNLERAAQLLTSAGWAKGPDGIYARGDQRAAFDLYYPTSDSVRQAFAAEFANQMRAFGIDVTLVGSSWTTDASGLYAHQYTDPIMWGWGANSPTQLYDLLYGSSASNYASYENATVDAHLDAALAHTNVADSYGDWQQAQWDGEQGVAPQGGASWVWIANVDHLYFVREGLQIAEQKPHPHGHGWSLVNNVDAWSWA